MGDIKNLRTVVWFFYLVACIPYFSPIKYITPLVILLTIFFPPYRRLRFSLLHIAFSLFILILSLLSVLTAPLETYALASKSLITLFVSFLILLLYPFVFNGTSAYGHLEIYSRFFPLFLYISSALAFLSPELVTDSTSGSLVYSYLTSSFSGIFESSNSAGYLLILYVIFLTSRKYESNSEIMLSLLPILTYSIAGFHVSLVPLPRTFLFLLFLIVILNPLFSFLKSLSKVKLSRKLVYLSAFVLPIVLVFSKVIASLDVVVALFKLDKNPLSSGLNVIDYLVASNRGPVFKNAIAYLQNSGPSFYLGTGPTTEAYVLANYSQAANGLHAHNTILSLFVEYGLVSTTIILAYLLFRLICYISACNSSLGNHRHLFLKLALAFLVMSLQDSPFTSASGILYVPFVLLFISSLVNFSTERAEALGE